MHVKDFLTFAMQWREELHFKTECIEEIVYVLKYPL